MLAHNFFKDLEPDFKLAIDGLFGKPKSPEVLDVDTESGHKRPRPQELREVVDLDCEAGKR